MNDPACVSQQLSTYVNSPALLAGCNASDVSCWCSQTGSSDAFPQWYLDQICNSCDGAGAHLNPLTYLGELCPQEALNLQTSYTCSFIKAVPTPTSTQSSATSGSTFAATPSTTIVLSQITPTPTPSSSSSLTVVRLPDASTTFTAAIVAATDDAGVSSPIKHGLSDGAIAGIVIGVLVPVILLIALIFICCRRRGRRRNDGQMRGFNVLNVRNQYNISPDPYNQEYHQETPRKYEPAREAMRPTHSSDDDETTPAIASVVPIREKTVGPKFENVVVHGQGKGPKVIDASVRGKDMKGPYIDTSVHEIYADDLGSPSQTLGSLDTPHETLSILSQPPILPELPSALSDLPYGSSSPAQSIPRRSLSPKAVTKDFTIWPSVSDHTLVASPAQSQFTARQSTQTQSTKRESQPLQPSLPTPPQSQTQTAPTVQHNRNTSIQNTIPLSTPSRPATPPTHHPRHDSHLSSLTHGMYAYAGEAIADPEELARLEEEERRIDEAILESEMSRARRRAERQAVRNRVMEKRFGPGMTYGGGSG